MRHALAISTWDDREVEAGCRVLRSGFATMGSEPIAQLAALL